MKIGTRSVLFGAHCFLFHWAFVALAWYRLYGFTVQFDHYVITGLRDWRLWVAFLIHDLGYWGKPNMDGPEGEQHPQWAADVMWRLTGNGGWYSFVRYHSRFLAKKDDMSFSRLCVADKLAIALTPAWLYLPMVSLTGEINEYMKMAEARNLAGEPVEHAHKKYTSMELRTRSRRQWYQDVRAYCQKWAYEHRDGREDTWTPKMNGAAKRSAQTPSGVWK